MGALIYALISVEHVSKQGPVKTENKSYFKLIIQIENIRGKNHMC